MLHGKTLQLVVALIASLSAFSAGVAIGWAAQINQELLNGEMGFPISKDELGWVGSFLSLGAAILTIFTGPICDYLGRKRTMLLLIVPKTVGWCLIIWAKNVEMMYIGRFLIGMVSGSYCALSVVYISETAQKDWSNTFGSFMPLMLMAGALYSVIVGVTRINLRYYNILCGVVPLIVGILLIFIPETPSHLLRNDKAEEARLVLASLRGDSYDVEGEMIEIKDKIHNHVKSAFSLKEFRTPPVPRACLLAFGLMVLTKTCGIDVFGQYTTYIFQNAQLNLDAKIQTLIVNIVITSGSIFQIFVVGKVGYRVLLWTGSFIMTISLVVMATVFLLKMRHLISVDYFIYLDCLPLIALVFYVIAFSIGMGPVPWILIGELFPQELKSTAASIVTFLNWSVSFIVTKVFLVVDDSLGTDVAFFIVALCTFITFIFGVVLLREKKPKSVM